MLLRIILVMLMATGLAGFGAVAWISTRPAPQAIVKSAVAAAPANLSVLAAARTLRPGVLLKSEDIGTALVAASAVPEGARPDNRDHPRRIAGCDGPPHGPGRRTAVADPCDAGR